MLGADVLIDKWQKEIVPELELTSFHEKMSLADELCKVYTHLNRDVVMVSLLLTMLQRQGLIHSGMDEMLEFLGGLSLADRLKICQVVTQAQTEYAAGEAKIIHYFCH